MFDVQFQGWKFTGRGGWSGSGCGMRGWFAQIENDIVVLVHDRVERLEEEEEGEEKAAGRSLRRWMELVVNVFPVVHG